MSLKNICYKIATLNYMGEHFGSGILASLLGIPIILVGRLINHFSENFFYFSTVIFFFFIFIILEKASEILGEKHISVLIVLKTISIIIAFAGFPFALANWKLIILGFLIYFLLILFQPIILLIDIFKKIEELPKASGHFLISIIFGGFINIILSIILACNAG
ncbi:TPA: hypothetical protein DEO28_01370 [Candidatus Dependentiae bacterium]|nr:MAG: hypothetical protein UR14_C0003G0122 [candidate division TM6 bacterium GW2011_GWE2_31_21]KKP53714.1 MAG: hypothetical protein UR43_C0003G0035 [candidate division TM6 bacterium GW2011_GWF2_33_332]HBS48534.1 hypothetical protein [Candidatus Dependentiae bacterium]HBZ73149.1 hypothetical protein [Candidatus Dependentiae bacterium]